MVTNNSCDYAPTQYNVQTGGASGTLNNVAPSSTSGVPVISQGASSQPIFGTAVVAGGGTGVTSATAYAVLCGGTTSTGAFQSIASVGTSGQILTSNGAGALPTFQAAGASGFITVVTQVFTGSGTYTPTANMKYCIIEAQGGGGAGGGTTSATAWGGGGGGGAGGYARKTFAAATIGSSQTITIGAGGTGVSAGTGNAGGNTTVGSLLTGNGGNGGTACSSAGVNVVGGTGGTGVRGDFNVTGGTGFPGTGATGALSASGQGASSYFGGGGAGQFNAGATGTAGVVYGSGGGGACTNSLTNRTGGAGVAGIVIITEFI